MIYRKLQKLLETEFHIAEEDFDTNSLVEDLDLDLVDLALALEDLFGLEEQTDISNLETVEDLIDFLQAALDM